MTKTIEVEGVKCSVFNTEGVIEVYPENWKFPIAAVTTNEEDALVRARQYIRAYPEAFDEE